jgi:hypothetical protein
MNDDDFITSHRDIFESHRKHMKRASQFFFAWFIFCAFLGLGVLGFLVWVIIKVMAHFGIL